MEPLAVDAALLRTVLAADIRLAVGRELMVRVASVTADGRGVLSLAGILLDAELPANVRAGEELRLQVRALTPEKVILAIRGEAQAVPPVAVEHERIALPGGGSVRVTERDADRRRGAAGEERTHALRLRYDAPSLGPIDLHLTLSEGALAVTVAVAPGALAPAQDRTEALRSALVAATERPTNVTVVTRREPVEVFA